MIGYGGAAQRKGYTSKDQSPYRTAVGHGRSTTATTPTGAPPSRRCRRPASRRARRPGRPRSFPYTPCVPDAERNVKVPSWLNDVSLYHNRGDTTFVGENSLYGDFFGLDDLFTENPRVVDGMIDIYKGWIRTSASTASGWTR